MNRPVMSTSRLFATFASPALLALAACGPSDAPPAQGPLEGSALTGKYSLIDGSGTPVSEQSFAGKWQMVYFGYAYCPDVCPFDVQRMVQGYDLFAQAHPDLANDVQPIFITVDPERDTPKVVAEFTSNFSDKLIGLTGTTEQVEQAAAAFFVSYSQGEKNEAGGYLMDHSRGAYLLDRGGNPIALLPVESTAQDVAAELAKWVR